MIHVHLCLDKVRAVPFESMGGWGWERRFISILYVGGVFEFLFCTWGGREPFLFFTWWVGAKYLVSGGWEIYHKSYFPGREINAKWPGNEKKLNSKHPPSLLVQPPVKSLSAIQLSVTSIRNQAIRKSSRGVLRASCDLIGRAVNVRMAWMRIAWRRFDSASRSIASLWQCIFRYVRYRVIITMIFF